ncbi:MULTISPECIES: hypothetical protein [unclassified Microcoleus]|uniref:hypothetical protein n=1 Tax=unclassified Microcoleus TaxID=2642155 RepID=UPI002FD2FA42
MIVEKNAENFQRDILSNRLNILSRIKGCKIVKMVRFRGTPPAIHFNRCDERSPSAEFSRGDGPILMTLDSGLVVGIGYITEKISLSLWIERTEAGEQRKGARPSVENPTQFLPIAENPELFPIDSRDPIFSDSKIARFFGKRIVKITLVKKEITDIKQSSYAPKVLYLPKEVGLILELETGFELVFSRGLDGGSGHIEIVNKEEISPPPYEAFHYIPLESFGTVESSSIAETASQSSSFSQSQTPSPEPEELQLPAQLWEQIPIRVNRNLRRRKVRIDCQVDIFGLPAEVFIEVGEGITLKDLQIEHLLAARVMFSYAEIVQLIHKNRQKLHDWMKGRERPDFDDDHLFWRVQEVLDNMCRNIREEIPQLAFQSQLERQELEDHLDYFYSLTQGLELCDELFIEIAISPDSR